MNIKLIILFTFFLSQIICGQTFCFETDSLIYHKHRNIKATFINQDTVAIYLTPFKNVGAKLYRLNNKTNKWEYGTFSLPDTLLSKSSYLDFSDIFKIQRIESMAKIEVYIGYFDFVEIEPHNVHKPIKLDDNIFKTEHENERPMKGKYKLKIEYTFKKWEPLKERPKVVKWLDSNYFYIQ